MMMVPVTWKGLIGRSKILPLIWKLHRNPKIHYASIVTYSLAWTHQIGADWLASKKEYRDYAGRRAAVFGKL